MSKPDTIRQSTKKDIQDIRSWLELEDADGVSDSFLCNWDVIEKSHQDGRLTVYVDDISGSAVAYQLGGLIRPGILQVRKDMRGCGIGRKLVAYCFEEAVKMDECILFIECTPPSSIPFWQSMGFTLLDIRPGKKHAYRILRKEHPFPTGGQQVEATIRFFPESRKWSGGESVSPYTAAIPTTVLMPDGIIHLSERVSVFKKLDQEARDVVVEIAVNGERRYLDKAKYPEANAMGVQRCSNGFYIDRIFP